MSNLDLSVQNPMFLTLRIYFKYLLVVLRSLLVVFVNFFCISFKPSGEGMEDLVSALLSSIPDPRPKRSQLASQPFLFAVDHCFSKSGQGTVLTGTVLRGCVRVGEVYFLCFIS